MQFQPTKCAICKTIDNYEIVYNASLDEHTFTKEVFSARRLPDRRYYQWVKCKNCGLLRSDPVLELNLSELYEQSTFEYSIEIPGLKRAYSYVTKKAFGSRKISGSVLEIGGGNGFYLEEALEIGFQKVSAVEPSLKAVEASREDIKRNTIVDILKPGLIPDNSYEAVTMFHVLDHLPDPLETVKICNSILKSTGIFIVAVHNCESWSAKILKNKSPIVDVEHTYLYSKKTIKKLFEGAGLVNIKTGTYKNLYSLAYLIHLLPISTNFKLKILNGPLRNFLTNIRISVPLGNMWASGEKPKQ